MLKEIEMGRGLSLQLSFPTAAAPAATLLVTALQLYLCSHRDTTCSNVFASGFFWRVETNYLESHSQYHSLTCHFHFSASFSQKKLDTNLFFDKKGFPAAFQNATPVHIFVAISVQALSLITNLKFWAYIFKTHVLPGSD